MTASGIGDVDTVLSLVTEDVVFLVPGCSPMRKMEFAAALRAQSNHAASKIDGSSEIQEIIVNGDWAFMWTKLSVVATPTDGTHRLNMPGIRSPYSRGITASGYSPGMRTCSHRCHGLKRDA